MSASMRYHNYRCHSQCSNWNSPRRVVMCFLIRICLSNDAIAIHISKFSQNSPTKSTNYNKRSEKNMPTRNWRYCTQLNNENRKDVLARGYSNTSHFVQSWLSKPPRGQVIRYCSEGKDSNRGRRKTRGTPISTQGIRQVENLVADISHAL